MKNFDFKFTSNREKYVEAMEKGKEAALDAIGSKVAGYASMLAPVDTGRLKNSITWAIKKTEGRTYNYRDDDGNPYSYDVGAGLSEDAVAVGTNVEYAIFQETGSSKTKAHPYLTPAVKNHLDEYKKLAEAMIEEALKNA